MAQISVLVADSQHLLAETLAGALRRFDDITILDELPATGGQAVDLAELYRPDVVLLDYWMIEMDGPAATRRILARLPDCNVLMLSWFYGPREIQNAFQAGAVGFLPKSVTVQQVVDAIRSTQSGERPVFAEEVGQLVQTISQRGNRVAEVAARFDKLTTREIHVLKMLSMGGSIEAVSREMLISQSTLRAHIRAILKKTGSKSHSEAVAMALYCGLIQIS